MMASREEFFDGIKKLTNPAVLESLNVAPNSLRDHTSFQYGRVFEHVLAQFDTEIVRLGL